MSTIDLFIQDFVRTNKLVNRHCDWSTIANRRFHEDGMRKIFSFESGEETHYAVGELIALPDMECFRIELTHPLSKDIEYRFDCLRMLHANTHVELSIVQLDPLIVRLTTRHRGLVNIVFVIRDGLAIKTPLLA
jgi:hypothetical protein